MYKLRNIAFQKSGDSIKGLTCPDEIALFFSGVTFFIKKEGHSIVYTSGTKQIITKKQVDDYSYEDCRIK